MRTNANGIHLSFFFFQNAQPKWSRSVTSAHMNGRQNRSRWGWVSLNSPMKNSAETTAGIADVLQASYWSFYKQWVSNICHSSMGRASKSAKAEMLKSWLTHLPESADGCTTLRQSEPPICYKLHGNPHLGFTIKCLIIWSSDGISRNVSCEVEFAFPCYFPAIDRRCVSVNLHIY